MGFPFCTTRGEKRPDSATTHGAAEKRWMVAHAGTHTYLSRVDDYGGGASTSDFLRDRLSDNRFVRGLLGLASGRGGAW